MKRHPIDPLSFVLGAFFLVTGLVFAFGGDASKMHVAWFWPVVLGLTGVGLMLVTVRSVRPQRAVASSAEALPGAEPVTLEVESDEPGPFEDDPDEAVAAEPGGDDVNR